MVPPETTNTDDLLARARAAWPALEIDPSAFARAIGSLAADGVLTPDDDEQVAAVGLGVACAAGDGTALRTFESRYFGLVRAIAAQVLSGSSSADELQQRVRERLFVAPSPDEPPRIATLAGRGDMGSLVRVAATRLALNLRRGDDRRKRRHDGLAAESPLDDALDDPELSLLKGLDRRLVKDAFRAALADLEPGQRVLLRHHLVDHLSIDQIARAYGVHRATAARRLARARAQAADLTRRYVSEHVGEEVEQTMLRKFIDSKLDLSISRLLRTRHAVNR